MWSSNLTLYYQQSEKTHGYRHFCEQIRALIQDFISVAMQGGG